MIVKALVSIRHNNELFKSGEEFEINEVDFNNIKKYVEIVNESKGQESEKETVEKTEDRFSKMLKEELVDFLVAETGEDSKTLNKLKVDVLKEKAREL
ncbi:hypothetical protein [Cetobacterium sp.]|uniref:hypothetical protein n=1 Tax=Cetobacterium sp. TaxID=2071632 RepID=UPI003EE4D021